MEQNISATRLEQYKVTLERTEEKESGVRGAFWIAINTIEHALTIAYYTQLSGVILFFRSIEQEALFIGLKIDISLGFRR